MIHLSDYKLFIMDRDPKNLDHELFFGITSCFPDHELRAQLAIRMYGSRSVRTDRDPYKQIAPFILQIMICCTNL